MHEALFGAGEVDDRPFHPLVSQTPVPPLSFDEAFEVYRSAGRSTDAKIAGLRRAAQMSATTVAMKPWSMCVSTMTADVELGQDRVSGTIASNFEPPESRRAHQPASRTPAMANANA